MQNIPHLEHDEDDHEARLVILMAAVADAYFRASPGDYGQEVAAVQRSIQLDAAARLTGILLGFFDPKKRDSTALGCLDLMLKEASETADLWDRVKASVAETPEPVQLISDQERLRMTGLAASTFQALAKQGRAPQPVKGVGRGFLWVRHEIEAWVKQKVEAR